MPNDTEKTGFLEALRASLADGSFIRLTLGKFRGEGEESRCAASTVLIKERPYVCFVARRGRQEFTANYAPDEAVAHVDRRLGTDYLSAVLFTASADISFGYNKKRVPRLTRARPTMTALPPAEHNRKKTYLVDETAPWLAALGITTKGGAIKSSMYPKFRQICRFVEITNQMLAASRLKDKAAPRIIDIGSGKGYLTFALHEHLAKRLGKAPLTRGVESNVALVEACNCTARNCGIAGLSFVGGRADQQTSASLDILIALHACDTATDDAIHLGIEANAELIITAPCCQQQIAPQLEAKASPLAGLLKYGLLLQRQADLFTDAARALLLEACGYEVRIIEFVSTEHTAKNLLIAAVHSDRVDRGAATEQYLRLAALAGFKQQRLATLLDGKP